MDGLFFFGSLGSRVSESLDGPKHSRCGLEMVWQGTERGEREGRRGRREREMGMGREGVAVGGKSEKWKNGVCVSLIR